MKGPAVPGLDTVCKGPALLLAHLITVTCFCSSLLVLSAAQHLFLFVCINVSTYNMQRRRLGWISLLAGSSCLLWQKPCARDPNAVQSEENEPVFMISQSPQDKQRFQRTKNKSDFHNTAKNADKWIPPFDSTRVITRHICHQQEDRPLGWCNKIIHKTGLLIGKGTWNKLFYNLFGTSLSVSCTPYPPPCCLLPELAASDGEGTQQTWVPVATLCRLEGVKGHCCQQGTASPAPSRALEPVIHSLWVLVFFKLAADYRMITFNFPGPLFKMNNEWRL